MRTNQLINATEQARSIEEPTLTITARREACLILTTKDRDVRSQPLDRGSTRPQIARKQSLFILPENHQILEYSPHEESA